MELVLQPQIYIHFITLLAICTFVDTPKISGVYFRYSVKTMKLSNNGVQVRKDGIIISSD